MHKSFLAGLTFFLLLSVGLDRSIPLVSKYLYDLADVIRIVLLTAYILSYNHQIRVRLNTLGLLLFFVNVSLSGPDYMAVSALSFAATLFLMFYVTFAPATGYGRQVDVDSIYLLNYFLTWALIGTSSGLLSFEQFLDLIFIYLVLLRVRDEVVTNGALAPLERFIWVAGFSILIFAAYQHYVMPAGLNRPGTFTGSSSVYALQIVLLVSPILSHASTHSLSIRPAVLFHLLLGFISGSLKIVLLYPLLFKSRESSLKFRRSFMVVLAFLFGFAIVIGRGIEDIRQSLSARVDYFFQQEPVHSSFILMYSIGSLHLLVFVSMVLVSIVGLLTSRLRYRKLITVSLFVALISENQLFTDNLFSTAVIIFALGFGNFSFFGRKTTINRRQY